MGNPDPCVKGRPQAQKGIVLRQLSMPPSISAAAGCGKGPIRSRLWLPRP